MPHMEMEKEEIKLSYFERITLLVGLVIKTTIILSFVDE